MREIKFRLWDKRSNNFEYWGNIEKGTFKSVPAINGVGIDKNCNESEQYTGLKDKNGVEIYEGDNTSDGKRIFEIRKIDGGFCICPFNDGDWRFYESVHDMQVKGWLTESCEVIGNIHESNK